MNIYGVDNCCYDCGFSWGQSIILGSMALRGILSLVKFVLEVFFFLLMRNKKTKTEIQI